MMTYGISSGLCRINDIQLPLGASSSLQNIHALVSNSGVKQCDVIVTESNVNDGYNIGCANYPSELVLNNIRFLYDELYRTGKVIVVLILPVMAYKEHVESKLVIDQVNTLHRSLCYKYGFKFIDLAHAFSGFELNDIRTNIIMPDIRHPLESFMHELGSKLRDFLHHLSSSFNNDDRNVFPSNFYVIEDFPELPKKLKTNSRFTRNTSVLYDEIKISTEKGCLCGIETWSDSISQLIITSNTNAEVIKNFGSLLSFSEVVGGALLDNFYIKSNIGKSLVTTEPSVNIGNKEIIESLVSITSLLFKCKDASFIDVNLNLNQDISFLIPSVEHHIAGVKRFLQEYNLISLSDLVDDSILSNLDKIGSLLVDIDRDLSDSVLNFSHRLRNLN